MIATRAGRAAWICEVCIALCGEILGEALAALRSAEAIRLPAPEDPAFLDQLARITAGIDEEHTVRGLAFLDDVLRVTEPDRVRAPRPETRCSFCSRDETRVAKLISGPRVFICDRCVIAAAHVHERVKLRQRYGARYDELVRVLFRHDPVGLDNVTNTDEYSSEARAVVLRLETCSSVEDVAGLLHEVFTSYFTPKLAGFGSNYDLIAADVWSLWCAGEAVRGQALEP